MGGRRNGTEGDETLGTNKTYVDLIRTDMPSMYKTSIETRGKQADDASATTHSPVHCEFAKVRAQIGLRQHAHLVSPGALEKPPRGGEVVGVVRDAEPEGRPALSISARVETVVPVEGVYPPREGVQTEPAAPTHLGVEVSTKWVE